MTKIANRAALRVRGLADLLELIPSLVGFHPDDSLVVVCIVDGRVAVTARVDLAAIGDPEDARAALEPLLARFPQGACVIAAFTRQPSEAWRVLDIIRSVLPSTALLDVAHVDGERWRCRPDERGQTYDPRSSAVAAEAAFHGLSVRPNRSALRDLVGPTVATSKAQESLRRVLLRPFVEVVRSAWELLAELSGTPRDLSVDDANTLAAACFDPHFAESMVLAIGIESAEEALRVWVDVVRKSATEVRAYPAVVAGFAAWLSGDGALANVCLEVADPVAGEWVWFRLLTTVAAVALPPRQWAALREELTRAAA